MSKIKLASRVETIPSDEEGLAVGQWYWLLAKVWNDNEKIVVKRLVCIVHLGSNYTEVKSVYGESWRVHFDEFSLERCWNPQDIIENEVVKNKMELGGLMGEVQRIMGSLGGTTSSTALVLLQEAPNLKKLKAALVKAKDKQLPELFSQIEKTSKELGKWMSARAIPWRASMAGMKNHVERIEEQIFSVELYTGLVENIEQIAKGKPAPATEKLRLFQRMHYMDEECLINYEAGGMRFESLRAFDRWIRKPAHRDRLLPFPRCVIAFRVRRELDRYRSSWLSHHINIFEPDPDANTFLYIRNGTNLYRLTTAIKFEEKLFPDMERSEFGDEKLYAKHYSAEFIVIPQRRLDELKENYSNIDPKDYWKHRDEDPDDYEPVDPTNVYYDDILKYMSKQAKHYNKIALVLQGLFDRSAVFHPHPKVKLWENFEAHVVPVYDQDRALPPPDEPDFEVYRQRLNASIKLGSVTVGQERAWMKVEADKLPYNERQYNPEYYKPYGNPGPGRVAKVTKVSRNKEKVSYQWKRERLREKNYWSKNQSDLITCHFSCKTKDVFNISAYKPGDYLQFFNDPRTRAKYLQWAPLLLTAEDYYAGKVKVGSDPDE